MNRISVLLLSFLCCCISKASEESPSSVVVISNEDLNIFNQLAIQIQNDFDTLQLMSAALMAQDLIQRFT
jgi:hypothetical protein